MRYWAVSNEGGNDECGMMNDELKTAFGSSIHPSGFFSDAAF
jgi:hypothetical protein